MDGNASESPPLPQPLRKRRLVQPGMRARDIEIVRAMGWEVDEALERTNPKDRSAHYTYLVQSYADRLKIGHSNTPKRRLSTLQNGSPTALRLDHTWKLDRERAKLLERQLHTAFAWAYSHGEWFDLASYDAIPVGNLFVAGRVEDALRLAGLMKAIRENKRKQERLRKAWYYSHGTPRERRDAEMAAKAQIPAVERAGAALVLEAMELGYRGGNISDRQLEKDRADYERVVAAA